MKNKIIVLLFLVIAVSGNAGVYDGITVTTGDTLQLHRSGLQGLAWLDSSRVAVLYVTPDTLPELPPLNVELVMTDTVADSISVTDFTGILNRGLVYDGEFYWSFGSADMGESWLVKIDADTLNVEDSFKLFGHYPAGLVWDGDFFWLTDRDRGRADRFNPDPLTEKIVRTVLTPGFSPYGISGGEKYFWVTDVSTGRMYRLSHGGKWNGTVTKDSFYHRGEEVGLSHDGKDLWMWTPGDSIAVQLLFD
jgi:hypothetical protein